jgi:hypothetical protein
MIPHPCLAVVFLYPMSENSSAYDKEEAKIVKEIDPSVYFMK